MSLSDKIYGRKDNGEFDFIFKNEIKKFIKELRIFEINPGLKGNIFLNIPREKFFKLVGDALLGVHDE